MEDDRVRWEDRYTVRTDPHAEAPSAFLQAQLAAIPVGLALDVACGAGRNALYLGRHGFSVDAIDIANTGLRRAQAVTRREDLAIRFIQADLDDFPLPEERYAVVLNVRFLNRALWPALKRCLRPGGVLLFETFTVDQAAVGHPRNPSYLLARGELHRAFNDFEVIHYEEGLCETEYEPAYLARLLARRPQHWPPH